MRFEKVVPLFKVFFSNYEKNMYNWEPPVRSTGFSQRLEGGFSTRRFLIASHLVQCLAPNKGRTD